ncbi:hypothetical protein TPHA_0J01650 [Tetrapisispora phaffii CBS 4417]|uniref:Autophagy-related protein 38 n=1 Tax=Tetrapisispora phaffii (strain ATCC 24235 / CBS 4417 / NBRC 1672 / NRRL Y-8282 / UCD 70-5) TaxID=1071381 RepID=G8BYP4_TETPH|nr:hypothetical protein TPHA_0J01650 [Tetrapisispora phaffii CBS 4417]CCE64986.1 hypothetical protein TPHA_0J01650 [Tetrapisispora phaffii CBS 4417]
MPELLKVYELINNAERESQKGLYAKARSIYEEILDYILDDNRNAITLDLQKVGSKVGEAVELLVEDVKLRIRELDTLIGIRNLQKPSSEHKELNNSYNNNSLQKDGENSNITPLNKRKQYNMLNSVILNNGSIINPGESIWNINSNKLIADPSLISIFNKFQSNLTKSLSDQLLNSNEMNDSNSKTTSIVAQQIKYIVAKAIEDELSSFEKELCVYENKKCKEYQIKLNRSSEENKRLNKQIMKLRERWDGLVESAKQKKLRKQEDGI